MGAEDRPHTLPALMIAREDVLSGLPQRRAGGKELTMGHVTAALAPAPCHGVAPRAVGGEGRQRQPSGRRTDHGVAGLSRRGGGMIPGARECTGRRVVDHDLPPLGALPTPGAAPEQPDGVTRRVGSGPRAVPWSRRTGRGSRRWRALWAPPGAEGGPPAASACGGGVTSLARSALGASSGPRRVLPGEGGAGGRIVGRGRRRTIPACGKGRRPAASEPRRPGRSAREATGRGTVQHAPGRPTRRGRRRTAASPAVRQTAGPSAGRPGRGAACSPPRPPARSRVSQRSTGAARARAMTARGGPWRPCPAARRTIWARVRSRGAVGVRSRASRAWRGTGVGGGPCRGLRPPGYHPAA
jgi:hypothetical protein